MFRTEKSPFYSIEKLNSGGMYSNPPDVNILSFTPVTKGSIDYIALRNYDAKYADNPLTVSLFRQMEQGYKEIFVSKTGIIRLFKKATEEDLINELKKNGTKENYIKLCKLYFEKSNYAKCAGISEEALSKYPMNNEALAFCGASCIKLDQAQKSIFYLTESLKFNPDNSFAITQLQLAREIFQADSLMKITSDPQILISLSFTFYSNELYEKSIYACQKALLVSPDNADAYCNICACYNSMGKWELGVAACEKALKINPDLQLAKNNLNWALSELKK